MADERMSGILIFTFSPVQGFIEASRRTRDFFTGSYILSWLTFQVMLKLKQCKGFSEKNFIYPVPDNQPLWKLFDGNFNNNPELLAIANFPNRFVLRLDEDYDEEAKRQLIDDVKGYFDEAWGEIYNKVFEEFKKILRNHNLLEDEIHEDDVEEQFELHVKNYFTPFVVIVDEINWEKYKELFENEEALKEIEESQNDSYGFTYDIAERVLGARKTFRPYSGLVDNYVYKGPKGTYIGPDGCSVCGERKSLAIDWGKLEGDYDFQGDKLCGVCLVKRIGYKYFEEAFKQYLPEEDWQTLFSDPNIFKNFPSTREMAGVWFKEHVLNLWDKVGAQVKEYMTDVEKLSKDVKKFVDSFKGKEIDEENKSLLSAGRKLSNFLSAETYSVKKLRQNAGNLSGDRFKFVKKDALVFHVEEWRNAKQLYSKVEDRLESKIGDKFFGSEPEFTYKVDGKEYKLKHRNSYFAILYADGDYMGKWLGLKREIRNLELNEKFHREFSEAISNYALEDVPEIVEEEHPGKLVYAGGDDVFAFLHPWDVMAVSNELRKRFASRLDKFPTVDGKKPSMSAGIVIGHAKAPLKRLISAVRDAEKKAKGKFGRDAFVISVDVRSGSARDFGGKWEYCHGGRKLSLPEIFDRTVDLLKDEGTCISGLKCNLSSNFVYELRDILSSFDEDTFDEGVLDVFKTLFRRSFQRKFSCSDGSKEEKNKALKEQVDEYLTLLDAMRELHTRGEDGDKMSLYSVVENFINMFYVARFIAKEERI